MSVTLATYNTASPTLLDININIWLVSTSLNISATPVYFNNVYMQG